MNNNIFIDLTKKVNCGIQLERKIVGVRFLFTEEEFSKLETEKSQKKMSYCRMVVQASLGEHMKVNFDNFACFAGARALGIVELDEGYTSGLYYGNCGLYQDLPTAKKVTKDISICSHKIYGIEVAPLEFFNTDPHVVIVISNPLSAMRLVQGYSYKYGTCSSFKMIGNQAMCAECTAHPYEMNDINFSLLCAGARRSGLKENEVGIGVPFTKFKGMVAGLLKTITPVENNSRKKIIEEKLIDNRFSDVEITYNKNYGDSLRKYDFDYFLNK